MKDVSVMNSIWIILTTMIIFIMQPGFAMLETGFTRAKNAGNVLMKNYLDFIIGFIAFWLIGFGIYMGKFDLFSNGTYSTGDIPNLLFLVFQAMFCATAATIVSGAMAERTKFAAYLIYSFLISALIYPVEAHWIWGNGLISRITFTGTMRFHDCAGGTVVHLTGGIAALIGAKMVGPRIGKYHNGKSKAIPGHNIILSALGVFLLWFAWFGFNTSALRGADSVERIQQISRILLVTNLTATFSAITTMAFTWKRYHKPDIAMTLNGVLGGLVASTAGCDVFTPVSAMMVGIFSGIVVVFGIEFVDRKLKIDDPVGASTVHGLCGFLGTLCVGIFSEETGLLVTGRFQQLLLQIMGSGTVIVYVVFSMTIVFWCIDRIVGLRVSSEEEIGGLDYGEHALDSAYDGLYDIKKDQSSEINEEEEEIGAVIKPVVLSEPDSTVDYQKISSIVIICKESRFEALKKALNEIGVYGITVSKVSGCGTQKGSMEYYRGSELEITLLPKIRVEVIVNRISVQKIVHTVREVLYTGKIGDGKIFVFDVRNVIKVRTGEEGEGALQDPESYHDFEDAEV